MPSPTLRVVFHPVKCARRACMTAFPRRTVGTSSQAIFGLRTRAWFGRWSLRGRFGFDGLHGCVQSDANRSGHIGEADRPLALRRMPGPPLWSSILDGRAFAMTTIDAAPTVNQLLNGLGSGIESAAGVCCGEPCVAGTQRLSGKDLQADPRFPVGPTSVGQTLKNTGKFDRLKSVPPEIAVPRTEIETFRRASQIAEWHAKLSGRSRTATRKSDQLPRRSSPRLTRTGPR